MAWRKKYRYIIIELKSYTDILYNIIMKSKRIYKQGGKFLGEGSFGQVFDIKDDEDLQELFKKIGVVYQNIKDVRCKIGTYGKWKPVRECYGKLQFMALKFFYVNKDMTKSNADIYLKHEKYILKQVVDTFQRHTHTNNFHNTLIVFEGKRPIYEVSLEVITENRNKERTTNRIKFIPFKKCDGDLYKLIYDGITFTSHQIIDILETISNFLMTMSYNSLHHNDIKLDNVLYTKEKHGHRFYLGDYGIVGDFIMGGTLGYHSPFALHDENDRLTRHKYVNKQLFYYVQISKQTTEKTFFKKLTSNKAKKELLNQYNEMETKLQDEVQYQKNDIFCVGMMLLYLLYLDVIDHAFVDNVKELIGDMLFLKPYKPPTLPLFGKSLVFGQHPINNIAELVRRVQTLKNKFSVPSLTNVRKI